MKILLGFESTDCSRLKSEENSSEYNQKVWLKTNMLF